MLRLIEVGREVVADIEGLRCGSLSIGTVQSLPAFWIFLRLLRASMSFIPVSKFDLGKEMFQK